MELEASLGNVEEFLQQCLEGMEPKPWRASLGK